MKKFIYFMFFNIFMTLTLYGAEASNCLKDANTFSEMNNCGNITFKQADLELNRIYNLIKKVYKDDKEFLAKLKKSQLLWIRLRDADLQMKFPLENKAFSYGRNYSMCNALFETTLTLQRVVYLKQWLRGIGEGDVCSGSIKRPYDIKKLLE